MNLTMMKPADIVDAPQNANRMDGPAYEKLLQSIRSFGFTVPILVNTRTGWIADGHHRKRAALELGLDEVPVVHGDWTPAEQEALALALNNPNVHGRLQPDIVVEVLERHESEPTFELTGFDFDEYLNLRQQQNQAMKLGREGDTPPAPDEPTAQLGEVYRLGRHTLVVGDATDPHAYSHLEATPAMCFTDPPYNVDYTGGTADKLKIANDNMTDEAFLELLDGSIRQIAEHTVGAVYICYPINQATAFHAAAWNHLHVSTTIAWVKDRFVLSRSDYHNQWEGILYGWPQGEDHYFVGDRTQSNVWDHAAPKKGDQGRRGQSDVWRHKRPAASRQHPTMKPVTLIEHAIRNSSRPGNTVLDPFGGSGSTLIAAENTGRDAYLIELDPAYADVIIERYASLPDAGPIERTT